MAARVATAPSLPREKRDALGGTRVAIRPRVHLDDNAVAAFIGGALPALEQSQVRAHLDDCDDCRAIVRGARRAAISPSLAPTALAEGSIPQQPPAAKLDAGTAVGPYVVERLLGAGGMGVVYAARDARLDRTVALKLIRKTPGIAVEQLVERLRRESKALARLSHPNVTSVYELGSADGEIYIAIEYVAGTTLRAWLAEQRPSAPAIVATFVEAGRGLAAAHAAGLVHRDFKPDNVLIDVRGAAKVTDFGLATLASDMRTGEPSADLETSTEITRTGAVIGTPAYMAPEQFRGARIDARADQFAFCVALYEALVGARPFRGDNVEELARSVAAGLDGVPRTRSVSPRIRRAIARGLAVDPEARFPSMEALLAELAPRRKNLLVGVGLATAGAWGVVAATLLAADGNARPPTLCQTSDAEVKTVWNPERRAAIGRAFDRSGTPDAAATWTAVAARVDAYANEWSAMHGESCAATHVRGTQSPAALDLRTACLERRRGQLDALLDLFDRADAAIVAHARDAVLELPPLSTCADVEGLARRTPIPSDPAAKARYEAMRGKVDSTRALVDVARLDRAGPALAALVADPKLVEFPGLESEAQRAHGWLLFTQGARKEAEQPLFRAIVQAQAARADDAIALAAIDLAHAIGADRTRMAEALKWVDFAASAIAAKGGDPPMSARLETVRGTILLGGGKHAEAEAANRAAFDIASKHSPGTTLEAETRDALGMSLSLQGKLDEAIPMLQTSAELTERHYGARHSLTATVRMNLANALSSAGRYDESLVQYRKALAIREELFGKDHVQVAVLLSNIGQMLQEQGKLDEARPLLERALAIRVAKLGPDAPPVAKTRANLGYLYLDQRAYKAALVELQRAGEILEKTIGPDHPARADDLAGVGLAWIGLGKFDKAIGVLERAVALGKGGDPVNLASMQAALGHALYASRRDRVRGLAMARAARAVLADEKQSDAVAEIDAWLPRR